MMVDVNLASLKSTKPHEYALRFLFGGIVTATAGLIPMRYGPVIGGLFLAFPAIFPASATLIEGHEKQRKQKAGYDGTNRGRTAAGLDAAGTFLGSLALLAFAFILYRFLPTHSPVLTLTAASFTWLALAIILWLLAKRKHSLYTNPPHQPHSSARKMVLFALLHFALLATPKVVLFSSSAVIEKRRCF